MTIRLPTTNQNPDTINTFDSLSDKHFKINNQDFQSIIPSQNPTTPVSLLISSGKQSSSSVHF